MNIRAAHKSDFIDFAEIHVKAFGNFFLTSLGIGFLRTYYKASLKSRESIAFCATDQDGKIIGFSSGCTKAVGFHKRLLLVNFFPFLIQGISLVFTNPKAILRLVKNLEKNENAFDDGNYSELLSIAVLPSNKGFGIGKALIRAFEEEAHKRGCKKISLTTDYTENTDVLSFYQNSGYQIFYDFTSYPSRKMYRLIKELSPKPNDQTDF
jgi:ribosomal protein S18 acetylase RimI-like enzyme